MPKNAKRKILSEEVYFHLRSQLATDKYGVGDRLNVRQIAEEFNVSRTTTKKAVVQLVEDGWATTDESRQPRISKRPPKCADRDVSQFEFTNQTDATYDGLLDRILRGEFAPGETINEHPLAAELGVNTATVRRAAEWLHKDGILERLPRRGWKITALSGERLRDAYDVRLQLEPFAVDLAASRIADAKLESLKSETKQMLSLGKNISVYDRRAADYNFHQTLCRASGNLILANVLEPVIRKVLMITAIVMQVGSQTTSFEEHLEVLIAIERKDKITAVRTMKNHLRRAKSTYPDLWKQR